MPKGEHRPGERGSRKKKRKTRARNTQRIAPGPFLLIYIFAGELRLTRCLVSSRTLVPLSLAFRIRTKHLIFVVSVRHGLGADCATRVLNRVLFAKANCVVTGDTKNLRAVVTRPEFPTPEWKKKKSDCCSNYSRPSFERSSWVGSI